MKWNVDISTIHGAFLEQAKVEALRRIAEQLESIENAHRSYMEELKNTIINLPYMERKK